MAGTLIPVVTATLTANGDTAGIGYVSVTDASQFTLGATCNLIGTTAASVGFRIVAVNTTNNTLGLRKTYTGTPSLNGINYGLSSTAAFTVADGAKIVQASQFIYSAYTT